MMRFSLAVLALVVIGAPAGAQTPGPYATTLSAPQPRATRAPRAAQSSRSPRASKTPFQAFTNPAGKGQSPANSSLCNRNAAGGQQAQTVNPITGLPQASTIVSVPVTKGGGASRARRIGSSKWKRARTLADVSRVRVLVGTRKGAFVLTADGRRRDWTVEGPYFAGWEIYHVNASPADANRLYASQSSGWFGQVIQRSDDGGTTWNPVGNAFAYDGIPGTHQWYDGTPHPWEFARVWHLEPSLTDPDTVYAGVEDAALFRSSDGGATWSELAGLRTHGTGPAWQPGAGGMCLHTIVLDPTDANRMYVAISAAGAFRSDDGGTSWHPINRGLTSVGIPDPQAEVGHCVHRIALHGARPNVLFMQKHWDVMRSDDAGATWHEVSGNLPTDFGFPIGIHAHEPDTVYVVPITSDAHHFPPDGALRVFRSRCGGNEWQALTAGLPQRDCYVNVLRDAMAVDALDPCGIYFGTTGGQVYVSSDAGDAWTPIVRDFPAVLSVEVQTLP